MTEKLILLIFSAIIICLFAMNFSSKWTDRDYEKVKNKQRAWFWLRVFKVAETKENYVRFMKGLSVFVIIIMIISMIMILVRG